MISLKNIIFSLFSIGDKRTDTRKNAEGKGLLQRFNELLAEDWDENILPQIEGLVNNTLVPTTVKDTFVPYLEQMLGSPIRISDRMEDRKRMLANVLRIYQRKGTAESYEILLKMMGFDTVRIIEDYTTFGFDSSVTFDDPERTFDSGQCLTCSTYDLILTGTIVLDNEKIESIYRIIGFVEPINAKLKQILYNGVEVFNRYITVDWMQSTGDLYYENENAPQTILILHRNGDVTIEGPGAEHYKIINGDLYYEN